VAFVLEFWLFGFGCGGGGGVRRMENSVMDAGPIPLRGVSGRPSRGIPPRNPKPSKMLENVQAFLCKIVAHQKKVFENSETDYKKKKNHCALGMGRVETWAQSPRPWVVNKNKAGN